MSLFMLAFVLFLSGCGPISNAGKEEEKSQEKKLTMQEVIEKSNKAMKEVKGVTIETKSKEKTAMEGMKMDIELEATMAVTYEPIAFHLKGQLPMLGDDSFEMYMEDKMMYLKDEEGWLKTEADQAEELLVFNFLAVDLKEFLEDTEELKDLCEMSHKEGAYVLEIDASGKDAEKVKEYGLASDWGLFEEFVEDLDEEESEEFEELMKDMKIESFKQVIWIDDKTFEVKKVEQKVQVVMVIDGMEVKSGEETVMTVTGKVDQVTIPEEVKKKAKEMTEEDFDDLFMEE